MTVRQRHKYRIRWVPQGRLNLEGQVERQRPGGWIRTNWPPVRLRCLDTTLKTIGRRTHEVPKDDATWRVSWSIRGDGPKIPAKVVESREGAKGQAAEDLEKYRRDFEDMDRRREAESKQRFQEAEDKATTWKEARAEQALALDRIRQVGPFSKVVVYDRHTDHVALLISEVEGLLEQRGYRIELIDRLEELLVCYRVGRPTPGTVLDRIGALKISLGLRPA